MDSFQNDVIILLDHNHLQINVCITLILKLVEVELIVNPFM